MASDGDSHSGQGGEGGVLLEDELGLVVFNARALRELGSVNKQVWEVWFCDYPPVGNVNPDFESTIQSLNDAIGSYFEWLSDGHYSPSFVEGGIVQADSQVDSSDRRGCDRLVREAGRTQDRPAVIFSDQTSVNPTGSVSFNGGSTARIPARGLFSDDGFSPPINSSTLVHEMGHGLGWDHSGGPINEYGNGMDVMGAGRFRVGTIAFHRYASGWIDAGDVIKYEQEGAGSYMLSPLGVKGEQMLVVPYHSGERGVFYTLGARVRPGVDECDLPELEKPYECNIPKEGVEVYLVDQRKGNIYPEIGAFPPSPWNNGYGDNRHVLGVGDSVDLGTVRVTVTERTAGNRFGVEVVPVDLTPITVEWKWSDPSDPCDRSDPNQCHLRVLEGDPDDDTDNGVWVRDNAQLVFSEPLPKDITLNISAQTDEENCKHPDLDWSNLNRTNRGYSRWLTFSEGTTVADLFLRPRTTVVPEEWELQWWRADLVYQPDQTFCLTIPELPAGMQWKDSERTVLPVTILNDDERIYVEWEISELIKPLDAPDSERIEVFEGDPTNEAEGTEWPSPTSVKAKLNFSQPVPRSFHLQVWYLRDNKCDHPDLPDNPVWTKRDDMGTGDDEWNNDQHKYVTVPEGAEYVDVTIRWTADREYEPDETFCLIIPRTHGGHASLQTDLTVYNPPLTVYWKDPTLTMIPVTIKNDDQPVLVNWESSEPIIVPEGNPTDQAKNPQLSSPTSFITKLTFSKPAPPDFWLWIYFKTDGCAHPSLDNPTWANRYDLSRAGNWYQYKLVLVPEGDEYVEFSVQWIPDRVQEPDETFCLYIPYAPNYLKWKDPKRTELPIILQDDDTPPPTYTPTNPDNTGAEGEPPQTPPTDNKEEDGEGDTGEDGNTPPESTPNNPDGGGGGPTNPGGGGGATPTNTGGGGGAVPTNTGGGGGRGGGGGGDGGPTNTGGGGAVPGGSGGGGVPVDAGCVPGNFVGVFCDEDGSVHQANIEMLAGWEITLGCRVNQFCPQAQISRSQMAAFLYRAVSRRSGPPPAGTAELPDVGENAWYRPFAQWSVATGVMSMVDGGFNPRRAVTRADMAEMIAAAFPDLIPQGDVTGMFTDTAGLDDATIRAMEGMFRAGVTLGCSTAPLRYCPHQPVTRAQMASFFVRALTQPSN